MKFNPYTQRLFVSNGQLLKQLHCPLNKEWQVLGKGSETGARYCENCDRDVLDSAFLSEAELKRRLESDPDLCLKIELLQHNIEVIHQ
jgi:hypothetical protein